jgi:prepilin-type processing-associated H-X9-DG protein
MERVSSPTNLVLIADVLPEAIGAQPGWPAASARPYAWWVNDRENDLAGALYDTSYWAWGRAQVHSGGAVYGFADGHVKWAKEETLDRPEHWQPLYYGP